MWTMIMYPCYVEEESKRLHSFDKYPARPLPFKFADPPKAQKIFLPGMHCGFSKQKIWDESDSSKLRKLSKTAPNPQHLNLAYFWRFLQINFFLAYEGGSRILNGRERAGYLSKLCSLLDFSSLLGPYIHIKGVYFQFSHFWLFWATLM